MKKAYCTSAIAALFILGTQAFAAEKEISIDGNSEESVVIETVADAFKNGKVKGLLRYGAQHRDSNYHVLQDDPHIATGAVKAYSALGGYLGYETAPLHNFSIGATFYTSNPFIGNNSDDRKGLGGLYEVPDYRFVSLSNIRMTPFTHEGATYENTSIDGLKINAAYITGQKDRNGIDFDDMVRSARVSIGEVTADDGSTLKTKIRGSYDSNNFDASGNTIGKWKHGTIM
jgi:hypothetical protein